MKSHSIPPRSFSICVYVTRPTSRATRFAQRRSRKSAAPAPVTSSFANDDSSKIAAVSRQARCSAPIAGDQCLPAQPRGRSDSSPLRGVGLEPVRPLPARLLAEHGPELAQPRVGRGDAERPPGLALVAGVLDVVVRLVDLAGAGERVLARAVRRAEPARVHVPDVERGRPLDDPLGHELPHAAGPREPVRAEARRDPEAPDVGRPEDELAVGRERLGAVDELDDPHLRERRHADDRVLHQLLEPRPVLVEQPAVEVVRDPVEAPRRAVPLVAAHDQAAGLRAEVDEERRVAHRRHPERQPGRLEHEVLVRHRHDRHRDARERAELRREHPARVHDDLGLDRPLVGLDAGDPAALDGDARHPRVRRDLGAAASGAFGERQRQLARVDVPVGREVRRAEHAVRRHRREERLRLGRRDQLERQPERLRPAGLTGDLLQTLLRRGEPQRTDLAPPRLEADLGLERAVEVDAGHHHLRQAQRRPELAHEAGGVERRAARQLGALDQQDVVPPEPGEPVEDRAAAHPASDHDRSRPRAQQIPPSSPARTYNDAARVSPSRRRRSGRPPGP